MRFHQGKKSIIVEDAINEDLVSGKTSIAGELEFLRRHHLCPETFARDRLQDPRLCVGLDRVIWYRSREHRNNSTTKQATILPDAIENKDENRRVMRC